MRAAKTAGWQSKPPTAPWMPRRADPALRDTVAQRRHSGVVAGLAALFFGGYLFGILLGRSGVTALGVDLATYYMDAASFSNFGEVFAGMWAGAFLQAGFVLVAGLSACGVPLLAAFFAAKGALLGLCAASVFVAGGAKALVIHWLLTCLPDVAMVLLFLWLAGYAYGVCSELFRCAAGAGAARSIFHTHTKRLLLRYIYTLLAATVCAGAGAGLAVLFAGVLL